MVTRRRIHAGMLDSGESIYLRGLVGRHATDNQRLYVCVDDRYVGLVVFLAAAALSECRYSFFGPDDDRVRTI